MYICRQDRPWFWGVTGLNFFPPSLAKFIAANVHGITRDQLEKSTANEYSIAKKKSQSQIRNQTKPLLMKNQLDSYNDYSLAKKPITETVS